MADKALETVNQLYKRNIRDADSVRDRLIEFGKLQAAINATIANADDLGRGRRDRIIDRINKSLLVGEDITDIGTRWDKDDRAEWYADDEADRIATGLHHLDLALDGGPSRGTENLIVGKAKGAKSTLLYNIIFGAVTSPKGYNAVLFTFENKRKMVLRRLDDRLAGKQLFKLKFTDRDRYLRLLTERAKRFVHGRLVVKYSPARSWGASNIRAHLAILKSQGFHADVIGVDYADTMKAESRKGETWTEDAGIYEDLRKIADDEDAVLWSPSGATKWSHEHEIQGAADMSGSYERAKIADLVVTLNQTKQEKIKRVLRIVIAAAREVEDGITILAELDKARCYVRTNTLLSASNMLIVGKKQPKPKEKEVDEDEAMDVAQRKARRERVMGNK
jgi:hypothetical protein